MKTTIKDISKFCNVSVGTVDRALNNRPGISRQTKERILQAAEQLSYHPNLTGRSLAKGKTMTIGVVCFDFYNYFFPELINTIEARAKEKGYFIYLILTHRNFDMEKDGIRYLCERQVDGIILFPIGMEKRYVKDLEKLGIPIVTIYNKLDSRFPFVGVNDRQAMEDAVEYIVSKGYSHISYLTPELRSQEAAGLNTYTLRQRLHGYMDGMKKAGLDDIDVLEEGSLEDKVDTFIKKCPSREKTAILCLCDSYAVQVLECLQRRGISVPDQAGLMGYDNIETLKYIKPRLTTVKYSVMQMGQAVTDILFQCIDDPEYTQEFILDYSIVEGNSL